MVKVTFEHEDYYSGILTLTTHFGKCVEIMCHKQDDEKFRLGGTAINTIVTHEGVILVLPSSRGLAPFRAFHSATSSFEGVGLLSPEAWDPSNLHCYVTEYYTLDMEGRTPEWFISKAPIKDAHYLFVNLDILDGGGNVVKRYRVSPLTGEYRIMETING